jgi:hypothetical protein
MVNLSLPVTDVHLYICIVFGGKELQIFSYSYLYTSRVHT